MTRISNLQTAGFDILVDNLPALLLIFKFALLGGYAVELKNFLSRWSAESRMFLSRCISRERSEDTLQRLLEKVNRVPLHEDFHFRVTNGHRAEVKRACTAKEYPAFRVRFATKKLSDLQAYHPNKYKFTVH